MSKETGDTILQLQKRGDFNITCFAFDGRYIAYSDAKETQVFVFDKDELKLTKLTKKITVSMGIKSLPPAQALFFKQIEDTSTTSLVMISNDLEIGEINLKTLEAK